MKKFISVMLFAALAFCMFGVTEVPASAASSSKPTQIEQPIYGGFCCDAVGYRRCVLDYPVPVGSACFCRGQGWGYTCL